MVEEVVVDTTTTTTSTTTTTTIKVRIPSGIATYFNRMKYYFLETGLFFRPSGYVCHCFYNCYNVSLIKFFNLQATKLFIVTTATKGGGYHPSLRFRVRFKILYRVIQPLIQHCLLHKMVYLNVIYVIATRNYEFFTTGIFP